MLWETPPVGPGVIVKEPGDLCWAHNPGGNKQPGEGWVARPGSKAVRRLQPHQTQHQLAGKPLPSPALTIPPLSTGLVAWERRGELGRD